MARILRPVTGLPFVGMDKLETAQDREALVQVLDWIVDKLRNPAI